MDRLGIQSLNAGAPDLRLSGDQTQRGTYTQRRRNQMAYGGIAGLDGRKRYWLGSKFQEWIKDPLERLFTGKSQAQIDNESQLRVDREQNIKREGPVDPNTGYPVGFDPTKDNLDDWPTIGPKVGTGPYTPWYEQIFKGSPTNQDDALGINVGDIFGLGKEQYGKYTIPLGVGMWAHDYQKDWLAKQPKFPADETGIKFQTGAEAMADPNLRFKPEAQYANVAEGGRIGYYGGGIGSLEAGAPDIKYEGDMRMASGPYEGTAADADEHSYRMFGKPYNALNEIELEEFRLEMERLQSKFGAAEGGRIGAQEGGLMDLGGMEKDYRQEGGFVPIGGQEKADDVPARLSKNEFVFTADAVRSAGGGDIDAGAQVMERLMENLEAGGKVSEESQGLEGAQEMFANTQRLQNRII